MAKRNETSSMLGDDDDAGQEPGARNQEPGARNQEPGARSQEPTPAPAVTTDAPPLATHHSPPADNGRPYCPQHNCLMRAVSSPEKVTYYQCPVPSCDQSVKRIRGASQIPAQPQKCTSSLCRKRKEPSYLEVNVKKSQLSRLWMECPACGASVQQPRPAFVPPRSRRDEDLSAR